MCPRNAQECLSSLLLGLIYKFSIYVNKLINLLAERASTNTRDSFSNKKPLAKTVTITSQMVAVYDVVEIAGISHGMISKTLAYDLNRNHTMRCRSRDISHDVRCRGRDISLLRRDVTEAKKRNRADFYDFCPVIFTFSDQYSRRQSRSRHSAASNSQ